MLNETTSRLSRQRIYTVLIVGLFAVLQVLIAAVAFLGGYLYRNWEIEGLPVKLTAIFGSSDEQFSLAREALTLLEENAYDALPDMKKLEYGMIRGMLQVYNDPYTVFVEPPQHELQTNQLEGKFGGIGVRIERDADNLVYLYPLPDSPALAAGVQDGDRLLAVGPMPVTPQTTNDEINAAVRGPVGERVTITVGRAPDYAATELSIARAEVALPSVTWNLIPEEERIGKVHINVLAETTSEEVTKAIEDLKSRGAERFIIDLRNNGGGLVNAGVDTARLFLQSGDVIQQQYKGQSVKSFTVDQPGPYTDLPIVVLINRGTASAAEIFAGAIQGQDRAPVVGTTSYGKDSIQLVFNLSDGSSLHVTSAKWWVPNLEPPIGGHGIQPDVSVPDNATDAEALLKAVDEVLKLP